MTQEAASARMLSKPHTQAEFALGMLTLPTTDVCLATPRTCTKGDISVQGNVWMLYRASRSWAIGAGATYAPPITSDTPEQSYTHLDRSHTRQYLLIDMVGRYYALHLDWLEGWAGMTFGGVVISDQFKTNSENPSAPILGPKALGIRTEGLTTGLAAGLGWTFALNWSVEASLRSAWWFLPSTRACGPTGECASLSNDVAMFSVGVGVGYRIAL